MFEFNEVMPNIYKCTIPAGRVLKYSTNIYLIKENSKGLLIDTGYASSDIRASIKEGLEKLGVDPKQTRIFITHGHIDHYGNVDFCAQLGMQLLIQQDEYKQAIMSETMSTHTAVLCGLDAEYYNASLAKSSKALENTPIQDQIFKPLDKSIAYRNIAVGDAINIGGYSLQVRGYRGHSICQLCLYEPRHKLLFSADQLLLDTVPVIVSDEVDQQLVKSFMQGLDDIEQLDCELILPGHSQALTKTGGEIDYAIAIIKADYQRLIDLLRGWVSEYPTGCTALNMACKLYKTTECEYLEPRLEPKVVMLYKVFSVLEYMHDIHILKREIVDGRAVYSL